MIQILELLSTCTCNELIIGLIICIRCYQSLVLVSVLVISEICTCSWYGNTYTNNVIINHFYDTRQNAHFHWKYQKPESTGVHTHVPGHKRRWFLHLRRFVSTRTRRCNTMNVLTLYLYKCLSNGRPLNSEDGRWDSVHSSFESPHSQPLSISTWQMIKSYK